MAENLVGTFNEVLSSAKEAWNKADFLGAYNEYMRAMSIAQNIADRSPDDTIRRQYLYNVEQCKKAAEVCRVNQGKQGAIKNGGSEHPEEGASSMIQTFTGENKITFDDVAGLDDVKAIVKNKVINPLLHPDKAARYNIRPGAMIMLYGLPGTGKTLIARAIAGEVDAPFYEVRCQDLISMYVGESSQRLQALFDDVMKNEKAILFFDEFDAIASKRSDRTDGADQEMNRFMATFLTNIGSCKKSETNKMLLIITATNRPWAIDSAMVRGQRIDQQIYVSLPDTEGRRFLVKKEFNGIPEGPDFSMDEMLEMLKGYGCSDIVAICQNIRNRLFVRDIENDKEQSLTRADYVEVISKTPKSYSIEELRRFEAYRDNDPDFDFGGEN